MLNDREDPQVSFQDLFRCLSLRSEHSSDDIAIVVVCLLRAYYMPGIRVFLYGIF